MSTQNPSPLLTPTYANAQHLLSLLQSNKTIINLFAASPHTADINASAIPEMRAWLQRAGYTPADLSRLRCIHVAGTKGKGSVCAFTTSILRQYPGRVGTYTSPHLVTVRERICLDGEAISRDKFVAYFFELWNRLSDAARREGVQVPEGDGLGVDGPSTKPFYFRFLTLLAFHTFLREGVTSAVVECGIGGEYDSTNVLPAEAVTAAVVTQLGIDHVNMLGNTVEKIAWHKAGIFKEGAPAYTYQAGRATDGGDSVLKVLHDRAEEKGTYLKALDDETTTTWEGVTDAYLEGAFQKGNMALATVAARHHLQTLGHKFDADSFENDRSAMPVSLAELPTPFITGLRTATLRGRCETISISPDGIQWYLDGAHTEDSLLQVGRWFGDKIEASKDKAIRVLVFNQQDRDSSKLLRTLLDAVQQKTEGPSDKLFDHAFFSTNDMVAVETPDLTVQQRNCDIMRQCYPSTAAVPVESVSHALEVVRDVAERLKQRRDPVKVQILVTGSFNLVGPMLRLLEPDHEP